MINFETTPTVRAENSLANRRVEVAFSKSIESMYSSTRNKTDIITIAEIILKMKHQEDKFEKLAGLIEVVFRDPRFNVDKCELAMMVLSSKVNISEWCTRQNILRQTVYNWKKQFEKTRDGFYLVSSTQEELDIMRTFIVGLSELVGGAVLDGGIVDDI